MAKQIVRKRRNNNAFDILSGKKQKSGMQQIGEFFEDRSLARFTVANDAPSYREFFPEAFRALEPSTRYVHNWHIDYLCDVFEKEVERIARGEPSEYDVFIINIIFRSLKSYITTICLNAWAWIKYPHLRFITGSYAEGLAIEHAMETRRLMKTDYYKSNFGSSYEMSKRQDDKKRFMNDKGGIRKICGVGGQVTGSGGNIIGVDDPINPKQADSSEIKKANVWWDKTFFSRINDPTVDMRWITMQRLAVEDLTGHVLSKSRKGELNVKHIVIPAEKSKHIKPDGLVKFYQNDLFFEKRFSKKVLNKYNSALGPIGYSCQAMQSPNPEGGGKWKENMFVFIGREYLPNLDFVATAWDLATTKKTKNSASAYVTGGVFNNKIYITECGYAFKEFHTLVDYVKESKGVKVIENKSAGKDMTSLLSNEGINCVEYTDTEEDKILKTNKAIPIANDGNVVILAEIKDFLLTDEMQGILHFPNGVKDDLNDAFVILLRYLSSKFFNIESVSEVSDSIDKLIADSSGLGSLDKASI